MPNYSTDKGFTGDTKDKKPKDSGLGGGGGADQYGGGGADTTGNGYADKVAQKRSDAKTEAAKANQGGGRGAGFVPQGMVKPFSRQKVKKGVSRPPTAQNLLTGLVNTLNPGLGVVLGSDEVTGTPGGVVPGLGFEGPIGESEHIESDPSQLKENPSQKPNTVPTKKKKNNPLGNTIGTLLADAGGSLVAG